MGYMKELDIRIRNGGEDAIAAACELAGIAKERRAYDAVNSATSDITDIVTVLRGVGFAAVSPEAGDSASLLHRYVTHAADEIERLREGSRWIPVEERLPEANERVLIFCPLLEPEEIIGATFLMASERNGGAWSCDDGLLIVETEPSHWMPLPNAPEVT